MISTTNHVPDANVRAALRKESMGRVVDHLNRHGMARNLPGHCLLWSYYACEVLAEYGLDVVIQAGSAWWPRIPLEQFDEVESSHFSYQFDSALAYTQVATGVAFPAIHCWVVHRIQGLDGDTYCVVDFSTKYLPQQCRELVGEEWTAPTMDYLWATGRELAEMHVLYAVHPEASRLALALTRAQGLGVEEKEAWA